jgi:hypothetical protein
LYMLQHGSMESNEVELDPLFIEIATKFLEIHYS